MLGLLAVILQLPLQAFDSVVHIAADQLEPLRVASNLILGVAARLAARPGRFSGPIIFITSAASLALNIAFLFQVCLANLSTGGLRYPLFAFVAGSLALAYWQWRRIGSSSTG